MTTTPKDTQPMSAEEILQEEFGHAYGTLHPLMYIAPIKRAMDRYASQFQSTDSALKYVYFIENEHGAWLAMNFYQDDSLQGQSVGRAKYEWTKNPLDAFPFETNEQAVEFLVARNWLDCGVTEHEFVSTDSALKELPGEEEMAVELVARFITLKNSASARRDSRLRKQAFIDGSTWFRDKAASILAYKDKLLNEANEALAEERAAHSELINLIRIQLDRDPEVWNEMRKVALEKYA